MFQEHLKRRMAEAQIDTLYAKHHYLGPYKENLGGMSKGKKCMEKLS